MLSHDDHDIYQNHVLCFCNIIHLFYQISDFNESMEGILKFLKHVWFTKNTLFIEWKHNRGQKIHSNETDFIN